MPAAPPILKRRRLFLIVLAVTGVLGFLFFSPLRSTRYTDVAATLPNVRRDGVVVFESAIHDEVNGALGNSLVLAGFDPLFICSFRYGFEEILGNLTYPLVPRIQSPYRMPKEVSVETRIDNGEVDLLVLTTCSQALPKLLSHLEPQKTRVVCVVHHSGQPAYREIKPLILGLAQQRRIGLLVLGEHVRRRLHREILQWAEKEAEDAWLDMPVEVLVPTFDYPANPTPPSPAIFPSRVVIQGNIEPGRRKYDAILRHLTEAITADPAIWGWKWDTAQGKFVEDPSGSPFTLHLLGRRNEQHPVEIKKEIEDVVQIHPDLSYPQFYEFLNGVDLIIPAFGQNGPYEDTASSSIAAAVIVRVPALVTERHLSAYTYLAPPAIVTHSVVESEIAAIQRLRTSGDQWQLRRASAKVWRRYQGRLDAENVEVWGRVLHDHPTHIQTIFTFKSHIFIMGKALTKVIYKPDPNAGETFTVIVNPAEFKKWKEGDTTIPLVDVVDSFEILSSSHGAQGILGKPSKQDLDNVFGTHVDTEVITQILQKGKEEASEAIRSGQWNSTNDSKGSQTIDTRGGRNTSGV